MRKVFLLFFVLFFIFSCSQKNIENSKISLTWQIEKQEIISDETFINSEENKKNKADALECMEKFNIKKEFDWLWINQAFRYNWQCYYFNFYLTSRTFLDKIYTTSENWKKQYNFTENWKIEKNLKYFLAKINDFENPYFSWCRQDKIDIKINILDTFDDILKENNIIPPRIIYTEDELYNSKYFSFGTSFYTKEEWNKWLEENKEDLEKYKNFLNYYFKYKNSPDYPEINKTFEKTKQFILKKYLEWLEKIPEDEPKCYFFFDKNWNYDKEIEKLSLEEKYFIYDLEKIKQRKKELEKL